MLREVFGIGLIALAGCAAEAATARTTAAGRAPEIRPEVNSGAGYEFVIARSDRTVSLTLPASLEEAWQGLIAAYDRLGIPVTDLDTGRREIGNANLAVRGFIAGEPLGGFIDCGRILGGPAANTYRVRLSILSSLRGVSPREVTVSTLMTATAADPASSGAPVACTSNGKLEERIIGAVALHLAAGR
jgi:hypothetical protein